MAFPLFVLLCSLLENVYFILRNPRLRHAVSAFISLSGCISVSRKKSKLLEFPPVGVRERNTMGLFISKVFVCNQVRAIFISQLYIATIVLFFYC